MVMKENSVEKSTVEKKEPFFVKVDVADDNGNGSRKLFLNGEYIAEANVMARKPSANNTDMWDNERLLNLKDSLMIKFIDEPHRANEVISVGKYAQESGEILESMNITDVLAKIESDVTTCVFGYIAAKAIQEVVESLLEEGIAIEDIKISDIDEIEASIKYITALPIRTFSKSNREKLIQNIKRYNGQTLEVIAPDNQIIKVKLNLDRGVGVVPEAIDITYYLTKSDEEFLNAVNEANGFEGAEKVDLEYFNDRERRIIHASIGEGTSEFPVTYDCYRWDEKFNKGTGNGVGVALEVALKELTEKGFEQFKSRQSVMKEYLKTRSRFKEDVEIALDGALKTQANEIYKAIQEVISRDVDADTLLVYGGGSIAMKKILEPKLIDLCKQQRVKLIYIPTEYAVSLEALGLNASLK